MSTTRTRRWSIGARPVSIVAVLSGAVLAVAPPASAHDPNPAGDAGGGAIPTMSDLAWIAGDWISVNEDLDYVITETWSAPYHETMTGVARTVAPGKREGPGADVISTRVMIIRPRPDGLPVLYLRRMNGALDDYLNRPAAFYPLMSWTDDSLTFENAGESILRSITFERTGGADAQSGADAIRITYTAPALGTGELQSQPTDFRARHAAPPEDPLIARAILFRTLLRDAEYDDARAMMSESPRRWWDTREGEGQAWTVGAEGGPWHTWDDVFRKRTEVVDWSSTADAASLTFRETSDYFQMLDRGWVTSRVTYFFDADTHISGMLIEAVGDRLPGKTDAFQAWAREHHPEEIDALMPGGNVDPSGDHPARMRALLVEWREAAGLPPVEEAPP